MKYVINYNLTDTDYLKIGTSSIKIGEKIFKDTIDNLLLKNLDEIDVNWSKENYIYLFGFDKSKISFSEKYLIKKVNISKIYNKTTNMYKLYKNLSSLKLDVMTKRISKDKLIAEYNDYKNKLIQINKNFEENIRTKEIMKLKKYIDNIFVYFDKSINEK